VLGGRVIAEVPLPIGGLMSDKPATKVAADVEHLEHIAAAELGVSIGTPFMHLSFLGLSVIPELRITDRGLVDVDKFVLTGVAPG
jgi:adenine deaminase